MPEIRANARDAAFNPALGEVVLDGGTITTFGGTSPNLASLRAASGNKSEAARLLGIDRNTLYTKLKRLEGS